MQEDKEQKQDIPEEATSSETLNDVEETEKVSPEKSETGGTSAPSPDGAFDSDQSGSSPKDDPGPM
jgi:hypothetical protein